MEANASERPRRSWESSLAGALLGTLLGGLIGFLTAWFTHKWQTEDRIRELEGQFAALKYQVQFAEKLRLYSQLLAALYEQRDYARSINEQGKDIAVPLIVLPADFERLRQMQRKADELWLQLEPLIERKDVRFWLWGWPFGEGQQALRYALQPNVNRSYWDRANGIQRASEYFNRLRECLLEILFQHKPEEGAPSACPTPVPTVTPTVTPTAVPDDFP